MKLDNPANKRVPDDVLVESYNRIGNIWKVGKEVGLCGQSVHERLVRLGIERNNRPFSKAEIERLIRDYPCYRANSKLQELADSMGRTKQFICRQAKALELTDQSHLPPHSEERRKLDSIKSRKWHLNHSHPRGMLGKHHTPEVCERVRQAMLSAWDNPDSTFNSKEFKRKRMETTLKRSMSKSENNRNNPNTYSRCVRGWWNNGSKRYFMRSRWEMNYADYLEFLIKAHLIVDWLYEVDTFWFDGPKRGVLSYTPDFKIINTDGSIEYHEVKGWMDAKSKTKIKRMAKYHPGIRLIVIDQKKYYAIMKKFGRHPNKGNSSHMEEEEECPSRTT